MALWGAARLGVTAGQLQIWWDTPLTDTPHLLDTLPQQQQLLQLQTGTQQLQQQQPGQVPSSLAHPQQWHQQLQQQQQHEARRPVRVSHVLAAALLRHRAHLTPPELVGALWAAAKLQLFPNVGLLRGLLTALSQPDVLLQLVDEDISSVLRALAGVYQERAAVIAQANQHPQGQEPSRKQQQQQQQQHGQQQLEGPIWNPQQQKQQHLDPDLEQQWEKLEQLSDSLSDGDLELDSSWSEDELEDDSQQLQQQWVERRARARAHAKQLQQRDLFPAALVLPLLQAYHSTLPTCSSGCIARTLWCVSVIKVVPPAGWMAGVLQQLQQRFSSMDATSCMLVALALARLRYLPAASWLKEFWLISLPYIPTQQQQHQQQHQQGQLVNNTNSSNSSSSSGSQAQKQFTQSELVTVASSAYQLSLLARPQAIGAWRGQKPPVVWLDAMAAASQGENFAAGAA
jgi:hypothetical protein